MAGVTGLDGLFFKADDADATRDWYAKHLGLEFSDRGGWGWEWRHRDNPEHVGRTEWAPFKADTEYMSPGDKPFMMNFRVDDLDALLEQLQAAGIELVGEPEEHEYGKFARGTSEQPCTGATAPLREAPVRLGRARFGHSK